MKQYSFVSEGIGSAIGDVATGMGKGVVMGGGIGLVGGTAAMMLQAAFEKQQSVLKGYIDEINDPKSGNDAKHNAELMGEYNKIKAMTPTQFRLYWVKQGARIGAILGVVVGTFSGASAGAASGMVDAYYHNKRARR